MNKLKKFLKSPPGFCTWNPADKTSSGTLSNGNLTLTCNSTANAGTRGTVSKTAGKWYWEITLDDYRNSSGNTNFGIGVALSSFELSTGLPGNNSGSAGVFNIGGTIYTRGNGSTTADASYDTPTNGDNFAVLLDMDSNTLTVKKNNASFGTVTMTTSTGATLFPVITLAVYPSEPLKFTANFGASAFKYTVPSGYSPIQA